MAQWHQYESRATSSPPSNDDSCAQPDVASEEEYLSPEQQHYATLLANTDVSQVPATLDQMALMMYYNQNLHATRPLSSTQYESRIQPLPTNSMYYNQ